MPSLLRALREDTWQAIEQTFAMLESQIFEAREKRAAADRDEWQIIDPYLDDKTEYGSPLGESDAGVNPQEFELALAQCRGGIKQRSAETFEEGFWYLFWACEALDIPTDSNAWDAIREALEALTLREPVLIFEPPAPQIHVPQLIVGTHEHLIGLIKKDPTLVFGITPREFEELIAEIFARRGFAVELTKATRDGGRDVIAINRVMDVPFKCIIECKRYVPTQKVALGFVQRLYGVKMAEAANKAILATTSDFTQPARKFAEQHVWDLDLKAYSDIMSWIRDTKTA